MGLREAYECEFDTKHLIDVVQTKPMPTWGYVEWLEERLQEFMESPANSPLAPCNTGSPKLLNSLQSSLSLVKNGMSSEEIHRVRGVIADAIDQLRAGA